MYLELTKTSGTLDPFLRLTGNQSGGNGRGTARTGTGLELCIAQLLYILPTLIKSITHTHAQACAHTQTDRTCFLSLCTHTHTHTFEKKKNSKREVHLLPADPFLSDIKGQLVQSCWFRKSLWSQENVVGKHSLSDLHTQSLSDTLSVQSRPLLTD